MNCQQFSRRMQRLIDARRQPETDRRLTKHMRGCPGCRERLETWQQIAGLMPAAVPNRIRRQGRETWQLAASALAGLILVAVLWRSIDRRADVSLDPLPSRPIAESTNTRTDGFQSGTIQSGTLLAATDIDPVGIWYRVQDQDWMERTIPAVRNVRESVAPLGRSLRQALTMLTIGRGDRTT